MSLKYVQPRKSKHIYAQSGRCWYEHEEEPVISLQKNPNKFKTQSRLLNLRNLWQESLSKTYHSNALANPRAVMIESLDTVVAYGTMRSSRRTVKQTSITEFHFYGMSINGYIFNPRYSYIWGSTANPFHGRSSWIRCIICFRRP